MRFLVATAILTLGVINHVHGDDPPAKPKTNTQGFPDLVGALKKTPGCLGVETAKTGSGKQVIFAWFEDKKAALAWYHSDVHQQLMKRFFPDGNYSSKPMADIPDDSGPILAIASLTPNDKPTKENPSPFKQIAIELYQPVNGGLSEGGRFAPEKMKIPAKKGEEKK